MKIQNFIIILIAGLTSCGSPDNAQLVRDFIDYRNQGQELNYSNLLSSEIISEIEEGRDSTFYKEDLVRRFEFARGMNAHAEVLNMEEISETTVRVELLESNELLTLFGLTPAPYFYNFTLKKGKIVQINRDNADAVYPYAEADEIYRRRLEVLYDWIYTNYPETEAEIREGGFNSGRILVEMEKKRQRA